MILIFGKETITVKNDKKKKTVKIIKMKSVGEGGNLAVKTVVQFFNIKGLFFGGFLCFSLRNL